MPMYERIFIHDFCMFNIIKIWYIWNFLVWFWMKIFPKHTLFSKKNCLKNIHFFACGFERRKSVCFLGSKSRFYAGLRDFFVPGVHLRVHGFITKVDTTEFFCLTSPSPHNPQNRQWEYTYFCKRNTIHQKDTITHFFTKYRGIWYIKSVSGIFCQKKQGFP